MNKLIVFDCDGVIIDSMKLHGEVESEIYNSYGIKITSEDLERRFAGISQPEVSKILEQETGCKIPQDINIQIQERKKLVFPDRLQAIPYIEETIHKLRHYPRCIASGSGTDSLRRSLNIVGLYDLFAPHIFSFQMVAKGKPAPDLFLYAADKMGFATNECVVIEDGVAGVIGGRAAGMKVLGFTGGSHCDDNHGERLKEAGAELVFSDMRQLPELLVLDNLI